jgi:preprotein translocase subunit SecE
MSITDYLKGTKAELRQVSWPTRKQAVNFTIIVIAVALVMAAFLGFFDFIFTLVLEQII